MFRNHLHWCKAEHEATKFPETQTSSVPIQDSENGSAIADDKNQLEGEITPLPGKIACKLYPRNETEQNPGEFRGNPGLWE